MKKFYCTLFLLFPILVFSQDKNPKKTDIKDTLIYTDKQELEYNGIKFIHVQGGAYFRGTKEGIKDEQPVHLVTLASFQMSKYEITNGQFAVFLNEYGTKKIKAGLDSLKPIITETSGSSDWGLHFTNGTWSTSKDSFPVVNVSWYGAVEYCKWVSLKTGKTFRLPTEAEWEFAARGGRTSKNYMYAGGNNSEDIAWQSENSCDINPKSKNYGLHRIGLKNKNELGLYDMSGNVSEWCSDWYDENFYSIKLQDNPQGAKKGEYKVIRGGAWNFGSIYCKTAMRYWSLPDAMTNYIGFRVVCDILKQ